MSNPVSARTLKVLLFTGLQGHLSLFPAWILLKTTRVWCRILSDNIPVPLGLLGIQIASHVP